VNIAYNFFILRWIEILIFTIAYGEVYTLHFGIFIVEEQLRLSVLWFDVQ